MKIDAAASSCSRASCLAYSSSLSTCSSLSLNVEGLPVLRTQVEREAEAGGFSGFSSDKFVLVSLDSPSKSMMVGLTVRGRGTSSTSESRGTFI